MKTKILFQTGIWTLIFWLSASMALAGIFDDNEKNWKRVFRELKKINARLVSLETGKMKAVQGVQEDLLRQIQEIKIIIPDLRGTIEQNQSDFMASAKETNQKLADLEAHLKFEIHDNLKKQQEREEKLQASLLDQFTQLKKELANDMEHFSEVSDQNFQEFSKNNEKTLSDMVDQLNAQLGGQKQALDQTISIFKSELIPTIARENEKSRKMILSGISKSNDSMEKAISEAFSEDETFNKKIIEFLQKSLKEEAETKKQVNQLNQKISESKDYFSMTHQNMNKLKDNLKKNMEKLQKSFNSNMVNLSSSVTGEVAELSQGQTEIKKQVSDTVKTADLVNQNLITTDKKINKLADSLKALHDQHAKTASSVASFKSDFDSMRSNHHRNGQRIDQLIALSKEKNAKTDQMDQSLQTVNQTIQNMQTGIADISIANEKLTRLIDILKTLASEQAKVNEVLNGQAELKASHADLKRAQTELHNVNVKLVNSQEEVKKSQQEIYSLLDQIRTAQWEMKDSQQAIKQSQTQMTKAQEGMSQTQKEMQDAQLQLNENQFEIQKLQKESLKSLEALVQSQKEMQKAQVELNQNQFEIQKAGQESLKSLEALVQSQKEMQNAQIELNQNQFEIQNVQKETLKSQQGLAKTQKEMQKAQLDLNENQFEIQKLQAKTRKIQAIIQEDMRKAHTDLARKANVTIARNNDIKKILQNLKGKDNPPATAKK